MRRYPYPPAENYFKLLGLIMEGAPPTVAEGDFTNEAQTRVMRESVEPLVPVSSSGAVDARFTSRAARRELHVCSPERRRACVLERVHRVFSSCICRHP